MAITGSVNGISQDEYGYLILDEESPSPGLAPNEYSAVVGEMSGVVAIGGDIPQLVSSIDIPYITATIDTPSISATINEIPQMSATIDAITPLCTAEENDVIFIDYDGEIRYSYSAEDFLLLTSLPVNPVHHGLTAQGWNWTLEDAKTYVQKYGELIIGQMYITDDGKTRLYITIDNILAAKTTIRISVSVLNGVSIDWGDGTSPEITGEANTLTEYEHTYTFIGDYIISLTSIKNDARIGFNQNNAYYFVMGEYNSAAYRGCTTKLRKVELGGNVTNLGNYAFRYCYKMKSITMPVNVTSIMTYGFADNYLLRGVVFPTNYQNTIGNSVFQGSGLYYASFPKHITSIGSFSSCKNLRKITLPDSLIITVSGMFSTADSLSHITIPDSVTSIVGTSFSTCRSLINLTIPSSVTSIGAQAFYNCTAMKEYHFLSTTPPTLSSTNAFYNIPEDCIIYVPYSDDHSVLNTYKTETNWSTFADYMQEEPQ